MARTRAGEHCVDPDKMLPEDGTLDPEVLALCEALNDLPGIRTTESCCGHGRHPYRIWFTARRLRNLPRLVYWFDGCHCGYYGWRVVAVTDCGMKPIAFMAEGPVGEEAYEQAAGIARALAEEKA